MQPFHDVKRTIFLFNQCGAALYPVTAVHVEDVTDVPYFRVMNVTADHTIVPSSTTLVRDCLFKVPDITDRLFDPVLDPGRQRPVAVTETAAQLIEVSIQFEEQVVANIAQPGDPAMISRDDVELIAVDDEHFFALHGDVGVLVDDAQISDVHGRVRAHKFVVIARDVGELRATLHVA